MKHLFRFAYLLCLSVSTQLFAQDQPVPIEKEPRHKLVFESDLIRIFDTRIPAGDVSLFHTHSFDSAFVCIDGAETQSEELGKPIEKRPPFKAGDTWYRPHAATPLTHRVSNLGKTDFRVLDIELKQPLVESDIALAKLPKEFAPVLDNERVRVTRLTLIPGAKTPAHTLTRPALFLIVQASKAVFDLPRQRRLTDYDPGDYFLVPANAERFIGNFGDKIFEAVQIEIK
jgi:quercetin dioxygenase-like cupin family protein